MTLAGKYAHDDLPRLMAEVDWVVVPSRWWENSPLVIQEAFLHQRPVICSDIGGMAEKVADGVDGLHFRAGDPRSLARVLERADHHAGPVGVAARGHPATSTTWTATSRACAPCTASSSSAAVRAPESLRRDACTAGPQVRCTPGWAAGDPAAILLGGMPRT